MKSTKELIHDLKNMSEKGGFINRENEDTFLFCMLLVGCLEKIIHESTYVILLANLKPGKQREELAKYIIKERTFTDKIKLFEFIMNTDTLHGHSSKEFSQFCTKINQVIRNVLFHFKLDDLRYDGMDLLKVETQNKVMDEFLELTNNLRTYINEKIVKPSQGQ